MWVSSDRSKNWMKKDRLVIRNGDKKKTPNQTKNKPCYIFIECPSSSLVSPSCRWQVGGFVILLYTSTTMPSLFMIQFAVPSNRSFVLISCCFASGSFSSMIFILSCATSFARRQKGGGCCWSTDGHLAFACCCFFFLDEGGEVTGI